MSTDMSAFEAQLTVPRLAPVVLIRLDGAVTDCVVRHPTVGRLLRPQFGFRWSTELTDEEVALGLLDIGCLLLGEWMPLVAAPGQPEGTRRYRSVVELIGSDEVSA